MIGESAIKEIEINPRRRKVGERVEESPDPARGI